MHRDGFGCLRLSQAGYGVSRLGLGALGRPFSRLAAAASTNFSGSSRHAGGLVPLGGGRLLLPNRPNPGKGGRSRAGTAGETGEAEVKGGQGPATEGKRYSGMQGCTPWQRLAAASLAA